MQSSLFVAFFFVCSAPSPQTHGGRSLLMPQPSSPSVSRRRRRRRSPWPSHLPLLRSLASRRGQTPFCPGQVNRSQAKSIRTNRLPAETLSSWRRRRSTAERRRRSEVMRANTIGVFHWRQIELCLRGLDLFISRFCCWICLHRSCSLRRKCSLTSTTPPT